MDNYIFLLEQNRSTKISFEKGVNSIEFTETIANMDSNLNMDQKKRDIYLYNYGKELFEKYPLCNNKYPSLNIRHDGQLSQDEIEALLTPIIPVDDYPYHKKVVAILDELKKLSHSYEDLSDKLEIYPVNTLELLAKELCEKTIFIKAPDILLDTILSKRVKKLNRNFEWTNENKQRFLKVNNTFMQVFEVAYDEALAVADELENRIKNDDKFVKDYEIKITLDTYIQDHAYDDPDFKFVLVEPKFNMLSHRISHCNFSERIMEKPTYLDKSRNWNNEYFGDTFNDDYICYQIRQLLDGYWSFYDIINIDEIWADIEYAHQYFIKNI